MESTNRERALEKIQARVATLEEKVDRILRVLEKAERAPLEVCGGAAPTAQDVVDLHISES